MAFRAPSSPAEKGPRDGGSRGGRPSRAVETTHHEALWYTRHVTQGTPLLLRLRDGEELTGVLEWYDRGAYRIALGDGGHLVVQKSAVQSLRKL